MSPEGSGMKHLGTRCWTDDQTKEIYLPDRLGPAGDFPSRTGLLCAADGYCGRGLFRPV